MKAFVSINMATSIDGKIATKFRGPVKLGSSYDSRRMSEIRAKNDVVINGASTFRAHPFPLHIAHGVRARKQPISAVVSSKLDIPRHTPWEKAINFERWIFCGRKAPTSRIKSLEANGIRVFQSKALRPSAKEIVKVFTKAGLKNILLEGGGEFNASFLEENLVDRIYLTFSPIIIGGVDSPTFVEGKGFLKEKFPRFHLKSCKKRADELYLVYER